MAVGPVGGAAETLAAIQQTTANQNQQVAADNQATLEVAESNSSTSNQSSGNDFYSVNTTV